MWQLTQSPRGSTGQGRRRRPPAEVRACESGGAARGQGCRHGGRTGRSPDTTPIGEARAWGSWQVTQLNAPPLSRKQRDWRTRRVGSGPTEDRRPDLAGIGTATDDDGRCRTMSAILRPCTGPVRTEAAARHPATATGRFRCALPGPWQRSQETLGIMVSRSIARRRPRRRSGSYGIRSTSGRREARATSLGGSGRAGPVEASCPGVSPSACSSGSR